MDLSKQLVKDFVEVTGDSKRTDTTVYGTIVENNGVMCVRIDGSDEITPIVSTTTVKEGERVTVQIRNHQAVVTGNTTNPSIGINEENGLRSAIEKSINSIRLEVADDINGLNSRLDITDTSITAIVKKQDTFSEFKQTVEGFSFMGNGGTVKISGGDINLTGHITLSDMTDATKEAVTGSKSEFSPNGTSNWTTVMTSVDKYRRDWDYNKNAWGPVYQFRGTDGSDATVPTYITQTVIAKGKVQAPYIMGTEFSIHPESKNDASGSFNIYGMFGGYENHMFKIEYFDGGFSPNINIDSPCNAYMYYGHGPVEPVEETLDHGSLIYFLGTVDFTQATVEGLTATFA